MALEGGSTGGCGAWSSVIVLRYLDFVTGVSIGAGSQSGADTGAGADPG